ncbi:hypothetical protein HYC85_025868 [Camellia sinensis]|uniref:Uncharacterized protein n=1 Tax=Camellia sinensis TaxID=4442 RepID=A0A7J7G238_CAMSI|nr:hypothetical protein HYC85_025868 [Camellia sinensis]
MRDQVKEEVDLVWVGSKDKAWRGREEERNSMERRRTQIRSFDNKVQELHKPSTEEGPTSIKDNAIVHAFGLERRGRVRELGFGALSSKVDAQAYQNQNMRKLNQKLLLLEQELYG